MDEAGRRLDPNPFLQPSAQVHFDVISRNIPNPPRTECSLQMLTRSQIGTMCFFSANGRLGIVLQKIVHPCGELKLLSFPDDLQKLVVSSLQAFAELSLRFLPVLGKGRFPDAFPIAIAVCDPKNLSVIAS